MKGNRRKNWQLVLFGATIIVMLFCGCTDSNSNNESEFDVQIDISNHSSAQLSCNISVIINDEILIENYTLNPENECEYWNIIVLEKGVNEFKVIESDSNTVHIESISIEKELTICIAYQNDTWMENPTISIGTYDGIIDLL